MGLCRGGSIVGVIKGDTGSSDYSSSATCLSWDISDMGVPFSAESSGETSLTPSYPESHYPEGKEYTLNHMGSYYHLGFLS